MSARSLKANGNPIHQALAKTYTVAGLEELAGINKALPAERISFWSEYMKMPGVEGLESGCRELRRRIEVRARTAEASI